MHGRERHPQPAQRADAARGPGPRPAVWAAYLDEAIELFGDHADVVFAQHHWPTWGRERIVDFLAKQRDLYGYIHDQALRLLNKGYVATEIAEQLELPPSLEREWHCRGYYGSLNHNLKAVYQRYLGWFDGNPAHLWPHPPQAAGERYVALAGGAERCSPTPVRRSSRATTAGSPSSSTISCSLTPTTTRRGSCRRRRSSSLATAPRTAPWRNFYLMGAHELRNGHRRNGASVPPDFVVNLTDQQLFDMLAIQIDGPRAGERSITIHWRFTDSGDEYDLTLRNGVLTHRADTPKGHADAAVSIDREAINEVLAGHVDARRARSVRTPGDRRRSEQARRAPRPARSARSQLRNRHSLTQPHSPKKEKFR